MFSKFKLIKELTQQKFFFILTGEIIIQNIEIKLSFVFSIHNAYSNARQNNLNPLILDVNPDHFYKFF